MKYSKKKYLDYIVRTIDALITSDDASHVFINNPGFGNIFDILKNDSYRKILLDKLDQYVGSDYTPTLVSSLKKASLNSFYTPSPIVNSITQYAKAIPDFEPKNVLEPCAGNGIFIRSLAKEFPTSKFTAFEKEILTVRILEHNFKFNDKVKIYGLPFETIAQTDANKRYDLVVSNIPFGANKIFDTALHGNPLQSQISKNIHSYFIYKSLDALKPSGISILLCTKNFMDKIKYTPVREHLIHKNNFIGGLRLPNSTFASENTAVVTDLLIFQNSSQIKLTAEQEKINMLFTQSSEKQMENHQVQMSNYFDTYPNNILGEVVQGGMYNSLDYTVTNDLSTADLANIIDKKLQNFELSNSQIQTNNELPLVHTQAPELPTIQIIEKKNHFGTLKSGNLTISQQKIWKINDNNELEQLTVKPKEFDRLSKIIALRDTYFKLVGSSAEIAIDVRKELDYQYDAFNFQYGQLHSKANYPFVTLDIQGPLILGLEIPQDGIFIKSDIFALSVQLDIAKTSQEPPELPEKQIVKLSLEDAIYYSLNKLNKVDVDVLVIHTGLNRDQIVKESLDKQLLYLNPTEDGWELTPKFLFLSGTIYKKINAYRKNDFGKFQDYIDRVYLDSTILTLEKVKPQVTPFEDLDIKLHEPWFQIEFTQAFIYDTYDSLVQIAYNETTSKYMVKIEKANYAFTKKFNVHSDNRYYGFREILEGALNSTIPYITRETRGKKVTDKIKMQEIRIKFDLLYKDFQNYIIGKPELKERLEIIFHNTYDAHLNPKYDGDYLQFQGLQHFSPYKSQKDTVAGIIINQGLLVNKEVGFGKTLDIALAAQKLKELDLSKKTLVIGLRSTVIQLEAEFLNAFPMMRLLVAHDKVIAGKVKRNAFFKKIGQGQHDVVLMSHDTFKFIPQAPEIIHEIIEEELANLERDLDVIYDEKYKINKRVLKGLEQRRENLEATLNQVFYQIQNKQHKNIDFSQMGFEHIMVDESHKFKNLMYTTRHNRVAGLNSDKGSERSKNLLVAIRTLQKGKSRDFQTTFLSGTPISNSITEVYVLFKYLIPHRMEQMNITSFDQWAQVFANKSYEFEPTVSGDYKVRERFRSFKKMKLLSSLYNEISIIVNGTTHQIDRPKMKLDVHTLKPTAGQLEYFEQIKEFLKTGNSELLYGAKRYSDEQKAALSLIALHHMRNASIDPKLLEPNLQNDENTKLWQIATEAYLTYNETNHFKGTQAIFSDLGVPKANFNVYDELKRILTEEFDIPKEEIVFIHDFKTDNKRLQCFKDFNSGAHRIIIGSTEKLGTGTNIQERLVRIHHVDIPYRPTDIDQRNGRGVRKGNIGAKQHNNNEVVVSFYIVENCTDALMLNNVNIKKNFIEQLTNGTIQFNKLDMGPVNDEGSIDYKTLLAVAQNDPIYLEKEQLSREKEDLLLEQSIFLRNKREAQHAISFYEKELDKTNKSIERLEKDVPLWESLSDKIEYVSKLSKALNIPEVQDEMVLGEKLNELLQMKKQLKGDHEILQLFEAKLTLKVVNESAHQLLVTTPNASYGHGSKRIVSNWHSLSDYMYRALSKIPKSLKLQKELQVDYKQSIKGNQKVLELNFEKGDTLSAIQERLEEINQHLENTYEIDPDKDEQDTNSTKNKDQNKDKNKDNDKDQDNGLTP